MGCTYAVAQVLPLAAAALKHPPSPGGIAQRHVTQATKAEGGHGPTIWARLDCHDKSLQSRPVHRAGDRRRRLLVSRR